MEALLELIPDVIANNTTLIGIMLTAVIGLLNTFSNLTYENPEGRKRPTSLGIIAACLMVGTAFLAGFANLKSEAQAGLVKSNLENQVASTNKALGASINHNNQQSINSVQIISEDATQCVDSAQKETTDYLDVLSDRFESALEEKLIGLCDFSNFATAAGTEESETGYDSEEPKPKDDGTSEAVVMKPDDPVTKQSKRYKYQLSYTELDVSACQAIKGEYYWDLKVNDQQAAILNPSEKVVAVSEKVTILNAQKIDGGTFTRDQPQFLAAGYVREFAGRSFIKRYWQYRFPGNFTQIIEYKNDQSEYPITIVADTTCTFDLTLRIERNQVDS